MGFSLTDMLYFGGANPSNVTSGALRIYTRKILEWIATGHAVEVIVKGVPPLVLADALEMPVKSLIAFGGTQQSSLPKGYIQQRYIYMMEGSCIRVEDLPISAGYKVEFDFQTLTLNSALRNYIGGRAAGVAAGGGFRLSKLANGGTGLNRVVLYGFETGTEYYDPTEQFQANTRYKYTYDNGVCTLESGGSVISTNTFTVTDNTSTDWGINDYSNGGSFSAYHDDIFVYSVKVWNDQDELVMDLVPAIQQGAVPVVGFYDRASGGFRTASAGTFAAGGAAAPTPDAPIPIVCNNGVLKPKDAELPVGYKRITGISMNNNCYYEITGFRIKGTDTLRFSASVTTGGGVNVLGSYTSADAGTNFSLYTSSNNSSQYLRYNGGTYNSTMATNLRYDIVISPTGSSGMLFPSTWDTVDFTTEIDFCVGTTSPAATSSKFRGTFYGNIEVDGRLKLIPCERISDNEVGYYDTYSQTFYEPIGATPTILAYDYTNIVAYADGPVETINVCGKNLFDGITESGYINDSGNNSTSTNAVRTVNFIPVRPNAQYTFSATGTPSTYLRIHCYDINQNWISMLLKVTNGQTGTVTTPNNAYYLKASFTTTFTDIQVEQGSTATDYVPYFDGGTATAEMLLSLTNYTDQQEIITGEITRNTAALVLTGTEAWGAGSSGTGYRKMSLPLTNVGATGTSSAGLCTHYKCEYANTVGNFYFSSDGTLQMVVASTKTLSGFKQDLATLCAAGTPVIVIYTLATPTTEHVAAQPMETMQGDNTAVITQAGMVGLELQVTYRAGVEVTVEEVEDAQLSPGVEVTIH